MKTFKLARAVQAALFGMAVIGFAPSAKAEIKDYEFKLVEPTVAVGRDKVVTVQLVNTRTGKPVPDAVIFATRLDMGPEGMPEMATKIVSEPGGEPGNYRFKAAFGMEGKWLLSLGGQGAGRDRHGRKQARHHGAQMKRALLACATAAAVLAAAGGGLIGIRGHFHLAEATTVGLVSTASAQAGAEPIYYQDPDGRPLYAPTPRKTPDGRDYRAVPASADLSFEDEPAAAPAAAATADRRIKFYRNPMGLPDTSPVPKKGSDGDGLHPGLRGRRCR